MPESVDPNPDDVRECEPMDLALRASEERSCSVFRDARIGLVIVSLDSHFLTVNHAFCGFLGYGDVQGVEGQPKYFVAQVLDIADRKRSEEARLRFAALVESSDDAIIGKTIDGVIMDWNKGAKQLYGYRAVEVIGKPISLLAPPEFSHDSHETTAGYSYLSSLSYVGPHRPEPAP